VKSLKSPQARNNKRGESKLSGVPQIEEFNSDDVDAGVVSKSIEESKSSSSRSSMVLEFKTGHADKKVVQAAIVQAATKQDWKLKGATSQRLVRVSVNEIQGVEPQDKNTGKKVKRNKHKGSLVESQNNLRGMLDCDDLISSMIQSSSQQLINKNNQKQGKKAHTGIKEQP